LSRFNRKRPAPHFDDLLQCQLGSQKNCDTKGGAVHSADTGNALIESSRITTWPEFIDLVLSCALYKSLSGLTTITYLVRLLLFHCHNIDAIFNFKVGIHVYICHFGLKIMFSLSQRRNKRIPITILSVCNSGSTSSCHALHLVSIKQS